MADDITADAIKSLNQRNSDLMEAVTANMIEKSLIMQGIQTAVDQIDSEEYAEAKATLQDLLDTYGGSP